MMNAVGKYKIISRLLSRLTFEKNSRPFWADPQSQSRAHVVKSYKELPDVYRSFFDALPTGEREPFPYTVLTPTFKGIYRRPERERLVCATGSHIHVLQRIENSFASISYRLDAISCVETGVILLHSWITIYGLRTEETFTSTTLVFNSITDHVMAPLIERVRLTTVCGSEEETRAKPARFSWLANADFKFMSYTERSLLPGERAVQTIYQPAIRLELVRLWGLDLARSIAPSYLCILTDSELILLTDDDSQARLHGRPHGAIWRYMPLTQIDLASLSVKGENLLSLCVLLPGHLQLESVFEASKREELERLQHQLNS